MNRQEIEGTKPIQQEEVDENGRTKQPGVLSSVNELSLNCAMTEGHVPRNYSLKAETIILNADQNTVQANSDKLGDIPVNNIREVVKAARKIQDQMDLAAEQKRSDQHSEQLRDNFSAQPDRTISFDDLASKVQNLGISREALAKALEPLPSEKRTTNLMEIAVTLGLPANASRDAVLLEGQLRTFVDHEKPNLPRWINRLQDPFGEDSKTLDQSINLDEQADTSLLFGRAKGREMLNLALIACNPVGWLFGLGFVLGSGHLYSLQRIVRHLDLSDPLSPALRELKSEAERHGGIIRFKYSAYPDWLSYVPFQILWPRQIDIILELKKPNPE
jgi:hypothetical protein